MKMKSRNQPTQLGVSRAGILLASALLICTSVLAPTSANAAGGGYCMKAISKHKAGTFASYIMPADSNNNTACRLDQGATSNAVMALQYGLNGSCAVRAGLAVDGRFGPATKAALKSAQAKFGVTPDGIYGPDTSRAFRWTYSDGSCS